VRLKIIVLSRAEAVAEGVANANVAWATVLEQERDWTEG